MQKGEQRHRGPQTPASTSGRPALRAPQPRAVSAAPPTAQRHKARLASADARSAVQSPVLSLQALALGCIGHYLEDFVREAGDHLAWLPADAKAALLAVARRRSLLYSSRSSSTASSGRRSRAASAGGPAPKHDGPCAALAALLDESWQHLDLAGCSRLSATAVLDAAEHLPQLRVVSQGLSHLPCCMYAFVCIGR